MKTSMKHHESKWQVCKGWSKHLGCFRSPCHPCASDLPIHFLQTHHRFHLRKEIKSLCQNLKVWRSSGLLCPWVPAAYQSLKSAQAAMLIHPWFTIVHGDIFQVSQVEIRVAKLGWGQWLQYIHSGLCDEDWISTSQCEPGLWRPADVKDVCGPSVATLQGEEKACPQAAIKAPLESIRPDCLRNVAPFLLFIFPMLRISHMIPTCHQWTGYNSTRNMKAKSNSNILTKQGEKRSKA